MPSVPPSWCRSTRPNPGWKRQTTERDPGDLREEQAEQMVKPLHCDLQRPLACELSIQEGMKEHIPEFGV